MFHNIAFFMPCNDTVCRRATAQQKKLPTSTTPTTATLHVVRMNKTYLRYELSETFGVVASPQSNAVYDSTGNLAISAALHDVAVWNLRQCSLVRDCW